MTSILEIVRPTDLDGLLAVLEEPFRNPRMLAGGTDLLLKLPHEAGPDVTIVDITGIDSLSEVVVEEGGLRIGAATRLADIIRSQEVAQRFPVLIEGAASVAGPQVRNLATLGGNVCNASPSADMITPLLVLGAEAVILSSSGHRAVPLADFFVGPGQTVLEPGELLEALSIPEPLSGIEASYKKSSPRNAMDLAVAGVAVALWRDASGIHSRIGLGAVAPTPLRATAAEEIINGSATIGPTLAAESGRLAAAAASPISDVRGSAAYRVALVERIVARLLLEVHGRIEDKVAG